MTAGLPVGGAETWLGKFGEVWFEALCTAAGCPAGALTPDVVGTDRIVHDHSHETIRVQVKTTEHPDRTANGFRYQLDVAVYDRLRRGSSLGYLALVVVHKPHPRWTVHYGSGSIVRASAYWSKLAGLPASANASTVTVTVPAENLLTPASLLGLFVVGGGDESGEPA